MKSFINISLFLLSFQIAFSQTYNANVSDLINEVNIDSLEIFVREFTGEDPVIINGSPELIDHRVNSWGNELAADYLKQRLESFGLEPYFHDYSNDGRNVVAIQEGSTYPEEYYLICAHYDAVDYYCADDNASGSAGVLEAARILSAYDFEYSVIYALWDEEEIGLIGSSHYASQAASNGMQILDVINMDMIAWDSDDDGLCEIHTANYANSIALANYLVNINNLYDLSLNPEVMNPGTSASDHSEFWQNGYSAILLIEGYWSGDFNPYYHTENDRISIFNMPYFHKMAKLAIGSLISKAVPLPEVSTFASNYGVSPLNLEIHPNPIAEQSVITCYVPEHGKLSIQVINHLGQHVKTVADNLVPAGEYNFNFDKGNLIPGIYLLVAETAGHVYSHKLIVKK